MMNGAALIVHIDLAVIVRAGLMLMMRRMDMIESAGCSQIIPNVIHSFDIVLKVRYQQRHNRDKLGHQKETHEPRSKPAKFAR
jgi:hypothetical protein